METLQNNKLMADFLGLEQFKDLLATLNNGKININIDIYEQAKFDTDWNWLMEVVKKIEELGNDVLITTNYIQIAFDEGEQFIVMEDFNIKITSVYDACIKFIKWYNENK
jgi:hypothetical protein